MRVICKFLIFKYIKIAIPFVWLITYQVKAQDYCNYQPEEEALNYLTKAKELINEGKGNPIPLLNKAIKADTNFVEAYFQLARIYYEKAIVAQHDIQLNSYQSYYFKKAEECFIKAYSICPEYADGSLVYYLGEMYYYQNQYVQARDFFKKYLTISERSGKGYENAKLYSDQCSKFLIWMDESVVKKAQPIVKINTPGDERYLQISADGLIISFLRKYQRMKVNSIYNEMADELFEAYLTGIDSGNVRIYQTRNSYDFNLAPEQTIKGLSFSNDYNSLFATIESMKNADGSPFNDGDICISHKTDDHWSEFQLVIELNTANSWDGHVSMSYSGKRIYFASDRSGGFGGTDLYYSELSDTGTWNKPINLGHKINTINNEQWPFIAPDDSTLYFTSNGYFGMGGSDVYFSRLKPDGNWLEPENIGVPFNSVADEVGVCTDLTGNTLYFASNRIGDQGGWDLYQANLPKHFRPKQFGIISGVVTDNKNNPVTNCAINLLSVNNNQKSRSVITNQIGQFSMQGLPKQNDFYLFLEKEGYFFNGIYLHVPDTATLTFTSVKLVPLSKGESIDLNGITFSADGSMISSEGTVIVKKFARFLISKPNLKVKIWIRQQGKVFSSLQDAEKRVHTLINTLQKNGIRDNQFDYSVKYQTIDPKKPDETIPEFVVEIEILKSDK